MYKNKYNFQDVTNSIIGFYWLMKLLIRLYLFFNIILKTLNQIKLFFLIKKIINENSYKNYYTLL